VKGVRSGVIIELRERVCTNRGSMLSLRTLRNVARPWLRERRETCRRQGRLINGKEGGEQEGEGEAKDERRELN